MLSVNVNFIVVHTNVVWGSWTGNPKTSNSEVFTDYKEASKYFTKLVKENNR